MSDYHPESWNPSWRIETILVGENYTRNEWKRWKITLETSGEDVNPHSKRVEKMLFLALVSFMLDPADPRTTGGLQAPASLRLTSSPLVLSVVLHLPHSFRV